MRLRPATLALLLTACSSASPPSTPPAAPHPIPLPSAEDVASRELTADDQIRQALDRLTFGARPTDYDSVRAMGVDRWTARQLDPGRIADPIADHFVAQFPTLGASAPALLADYPPAGVQKRKEGAAMTAADSAARRAMARESRRLLGELQAAKVGRAVISERQLDEVMVDFWFNHFNVYAAKGPERYYLAQYEREAIRPHVLGRFRDLLGAVAHSPAMLFYLDNWESRANADEPVLVAQHGNGGGRHGMGRGVANGGAGGGRFPPPANGSAIVKRQSAGLNENYARELLELHTLGVDGGYTQEDVINVARAFTGWSIEKPQQTGTFLFRPEWHDAGAKSVLGHELPAGNGVEDGEHVLDILAHDPHTAEHIAKQLAMRFVSDSPPPELVTRAANTFLETGGDIRETVRVIVTSREFFSQAAYKTKVKSPLRLVVSSLRAVDAAPDTTARTAQIIARLGEPLYMHQAPNGYPLTGESWINSGAILNRINFGLAVAAGRVPGASISMWPQGLAFEAKSHGEQVDGVIALFFGGEVSPDTRRILERGVNPLAASAPPTLADSIDEALMIIHDVMGFQRTVGLALGAPEFQRH